LQASVSAQNGRLANGTTAEQMRHVMRPVASLAGCRLSSQRTVALELSWRRG
jgi:hypothetical protein